MVSKVAIVELGQDGTQSFRHALELIGKIDDLNTAKRSVVIKVGVFDPEAQNHTTVSVVNAIINGFDKAPKIYLAESDNYRGTGLERLQLWKELFSERVMPFNLSTDTDTRNRWKPNIILVGRDAIAVETVGATLAGLNPEKMPIIQEAVNRGLGEGNINKIEILGASLETLKERLASPSTIPKRRTSTKKKS